jgi:hypothetical protein
MIFMKLESIFLALNALNTNELINLKNKFDAPAFLQKLKDPSLIITADLFTPEEHSVFEKMRAFLQAVDAEDLQSHSEDPSRLTSEKTFIAAAGSIIPVRLFRAIYPCEEYFIEDSIKKIPIICSIMAMLKYSLSENKEEIKCLRTCTALNEVPRLAGILNKSSTLLAALQYKKKLTREIEAWKKNIWYKAAITTDFNYQAALQNRETTKELINAWQSFKKTLDAQWEEVGRTPEVELILRKVLGYFGVIQRAALPKDKDALRQRIYIENPALSWQYNIWYVLTHAETSREKHDELLSGNNIEELIDSWDIFLELTSQAQQWHAPLAVQNIALKILTKLCLLFNVKEISMLPKKEVLKNALPKNKAAKCRWWYANKYAKTIFSTVDSVINNDVFFNEFAEIVKQLYQVRAAILAKKSQLYARNYAFVRNSAGNKNIPRKILQSSATGVFVCNDYDGLFYVNKEGKAQNIISKSKDFKNILGDIKNSPSFKETKNELSAEDLTEIKTLTKYDIHEKASKRIRAIDKALMEIAKAKAAIKTTYVDLCKDNKYLETRNVYAVISKAPAREKALFKKRVLQELAELAESDPLTTHQVWGKRVFFNSNTQSATDIANIYQAAKNIKITSVNWHWLNKLLTATTIEEITAAIDIIVNHAAILQKKDPSADTNAFYKLIIASMIKQHPKVVSKKNHSFLFKTLDLKIKLLHGMIDEKLSSPVCKDVIQLSERKKVCANFIEIMRIERLTINSIKIITKQAEILKKHNPSANIDFLYEWVILDMLNQTPEMATLVFRFKELCNEIVSKQKSSAWIKKSPKYQARLNAKLNIGRKFIEVVQTEKKQENPKSLINVIAKQAKIFKQDDLSVNIDVLYVGVILQMLNQTPEIATLYLQFEKLRNEIISEKKSSEWDAKSAKEKAKANKKLSICTKFVGIVQTSKKPEDAISLNYKRPNYLGYTYLNEAYFATLQNLYREVALGKKEVASEIQRLWQRHHVKLVSLSALLSSLSLLPDELKQYNESVLPDFNQVEKYRTSILGEIAKNTLSPNQLIELNNLLKRLTKIKYYLVSIVGSDKEITTYNGLLKAIQLKLISTTKTREFTGEHDELIKAFGKLVDKYANIEKPPVDNWTLLREQHAQASSHAKTSSMKRTSVWLAMLGILAKGLKKSCKAIFFNQSALFFSVSKHYDRIKGVAKHQPRLLQR